MVSSGITENCSFSHCPRSGHNTMYWLKTTMMLYLIFILGHCPHESWVQCTSENIVNIRSESLANLFFICQRFFFWFHNFNCKRSHYEKNDIVSCTPISLLKWCWKNSCWLAVCANLSFWLVDRKTQKLTNTLPKKDVFTDMPCSIAKDYWFHNGY